MNITIANQKGGCGKTSTAALIVKALAVNGKTVIAVDADPQGGLTRFLAPELEPERGLFEVLTGGEIADNVHRVYLGKKQEVAVDLLPGDFRLDKILLSLDPYEFEREFEATGYDHVILDTPPTMQGITRAAIIYSDLVVVPVDMSIATHRPTKYTLKCVADLKKKAKVIFIGYKEPKAESKGYRSEVNRLFMKDFKEWYVGTIDRTAAMASTIESNMSFTASKKARVFEPLVGMLDVH